MVSIANNLQAVRARIDKAASASGRNADDIYLLAVSKTWPGEYVRAAATAGQRAFGENYVQEGVEKVVELRDLALDWHFIGPLQSNKTRIVAEHFDWVHSLDRLKIGERLSSQRPPELGPLNVCIQVNVSGEASKSGCSPADLPALARALTQLPRLRLRGLMAIPAPTDDPAAQRAPLAELARLQSRLNADGFGLDTLSMGMSHDLEAAVFEGSTMLRIGTAIFGDRKTS